MDSTQDKLELQKSFILLTEKIDDLLTPIDYKDGGIDNVDIRELEENLDLIFSDIDSTYLKSLLINHIKDCESRLSLTIRYQKEKVKKLNKQVKKLYDEETKLSEDDFSVFDKLSEANQKYEIATVILDYYKKQIDFLPIWIEKKKNNIKDSNQNIIENYFTDLSTFYFLNDSKNELDFVNEQIDLTKFKLQKYIVENVFFENTVFYYDSVKYLNFLETKKRSIEQVSFKETYTKTKSDDKNTIWFKVGLKFATGELPINKNQNFSEIATKYFPELKTKNGNSARPYITATCNNYKTDKDIFSKEKHPKKIIDYCKENQINICETFIEKIPKNFFLDI